MSEIWLFSGTSDELSMFSGTRNLKNSGGYVVVMVLNSGLMKIGSTENVIAHVRTWQNTAKKVGKVDIDVKTLHVSMALGRDAMHIRNNLKKCLSHHLVEGTDLYQVSDEEMNDAFSKLFNRWLDIKANFHGILGNFARRTAQGDAS